MKTLVFIAISIYWHKWKVICLACNTASKETNSILIYRSDESQSITQLCRFKEHNTEELQISILPLLHRKCQLYETKALSIAHML